MKPQAVPTPLNRKDTVILCRGTAVADEAIATQQVSISGATVGPVGLLPWVTGSVSKQFRLYGEATMEPRIWKAVITAVGRGPVSRMQAKGSWEMILTFCCFLVTFLLR